MQEKGFRLIVDAHKNGQNTQQIEEPYRQIIQYSIPCLVNGRPTSQLMIVMAGESGAGKSATLNKLFHDDNLCKTSDRTSETHHVTEYTKHLVIKDPTFPLQADISIIDVPGTHDTVAAKNEDNLQQIRLFRKMHPALMPFHASLKNSTKPINKEAELAFTKSKLKVRSEVFPNLILLIVAASDKRMEGPESRLSVTLEAIRTTNLVDMRKPNLIVVVTMCLYLGTKRNEYLEGKKGIKRMINEAVYRILKVTNVRVVFIDNKAEKFFEKKESSDFYTLPDDEQSHQNLFKAIRELLKQNGDTLGLLLAGHYFNSGIPERNEKAREHILSYNSDNVTYNEVEQVVYLRCSDDFTTDDIEQRNRTEESGQSPPVAERYTTCTSETIKAAADITFIAKKEIIPFPHSVLGHGFFPVTENLKMHGMFTDLRTRQETLGRREFRIPECISIVRGVGRNFEKLTSDSKNEYDQQKECSYGSGFKLPFSFSTDINSIGKWEQDQFGSNSDIHSTFIHEIRYARLTMGNFDTSLLSSDLREDIDNLPDQFNTRHRGKFFNFFDKWGTHFVSEVWFGGSIQVTISIRSRELTRSQRDAVENYIKSTFFGFARDKESLSDFSENYRRTIEQSTVTILGGNPPNIILLNQLTPEIICEWEASVADNPVELENRKGLSPFYCYVPRNKHNATALLCATYEFLRDNSPPPTTREEESGKAFQDSKDSGFLKTCFNNLLSYMLDL